MSARLDFDAVSSIGAEPSASQGCPPMGECQNIVAISVGGSELRFSWGAAHQLGTAAYWVQQTRERQPAADHRLGASLAEEAVACVLGGFGLPARVGLAAFEAVRDAGLISTDPPPRPSDVERVLTRPLLVDGRERPTRYRFPKQRAERVASVLRFLSGQEQPQDGHELRNWLMMAPGIGPKTASWIARNAGVEGLAIIDIHVHRAGLAAGFFAPRWRLPRDYALFERAFCQIAEMGGVSTAALDARIWRDLSFLGRAGSLMTGLSPPQGQVA